MTKRASLTRRTFLGAVAAVPAAAALTSCDSAMLSPDASMAIDGSVGGPIDASRRLDASRRVDAFAPDAIAASDAGGEADAGPACEGHPRIDLRRDCGAVGDGSTNDTAAFQRAAEMLQEAGGGELIIPPGTYIVGRQNVRPMSSGPYYQHEEIFTVQGLSCLKITGYGATLRLAAGLHYGAFDAMTGAPIPGPTTARSAAAHVGRFFEIVECADVEIEGMELDGNSSELVLGGEWGDTGRQAAATGVWLNRCLNARVVDIHTHHHGLDGITVSHLPLRQDRRKPHTLIRVNSEYNGRQGISWIGGWGLECTDCKFNHTGRTINRGGGVGDGEPLASKPGAGLDTEPNAGTTQQSRDGLFTRCEFINNTGAGVLSAVGDGGYTTFVDCTFWATTSYSLWLRHPGLRFVDCRIYGTAQHAHDGSTPDDPTPNPELATLFERCTFEDREWTDGNVARRNNLYNTNGADGATWRDCTFINHRVRAVNMAGTETRERFEGCTFNFSYSTLSSGTHQATFAGSEIIGCHFTESAAISEGTRNYFIRVDNVTVTAPPATIVDGPRVKWGSAGSSGLTGEIPPT